MLNTAIGSRRGAGWLALAGAAGFVLLSCSDDKSTQPDTTPPVASITAPAEGDTLQTDPVSITVTATDNRGVVRVDFFDGTTLLGSDSQAPYGFEWAWGALADGADHALRVSAVDQAGNSGADTINVFVPEPDTEAPSVAFTAPLEGGVVVGHPTLAVEASDTGSGQAAVASVSFYAGATLLGIDTAAPYEQIWNTTGLATGEIYALSATAADRAGNLAADTVHVTLQADATPPTVAITTPAGTALASGDVITAAASDAGGLAAVRFYLGETLVGIDTTDPYEQPALALLYWADGAAHDVTAEAEDLAGNTQRAAAVAFTVTKPATAWLSEVLAVAGPGEQDGHRFERLVRLNPDVRYRGTQIDTIVVSTCILGHTALIDYEVKGCFHVMPVPPPDTTRFHIDRCIVVNGVNKARLPAPPQTGLSWGGAIEFGDEHAPPSWEPPCGQVTHCTIYKSLQSGIYLHRSRADRLVIKNNILFQNNLGGCVRYADDVTPAITFNCADQNQPCDYGEHCGCPSNPLPEEILLTDPDAHLGTNISADPDFQPRFTKPSQVRRERAHFTLGPDTPCRDQGEDGTYMGALPPE